MLDLVAYQTPDERALQVEQALAEILRDVHTEAVARGVEDALGDLGKQIGDQAVVAVYERLSPMTLGTLIAARTGGYSLTAMTATPGCIAEALAVRFMTVPAQAEPANVLTLQDEALDLIATIVLLESNEERREAVVHAIADNPAASRYAIFAFLGAECTFEIESSGDYGEVQKEDAFEIVDVQLSQLGELFEKYAAALWEEIVSHLERDEKQHHAADEDEAGEEIAQDTLHASIRSFAAEYFNETREALFVKYGRKETLSQSTGDDDMFRPLDF